MKEIKPGDLFRVSAEKRAPKRGQCYFNAAFVTALEDHDNTSEFYILEPIDPANVTIADEVEPRRNWIIEQVGSTVRIASMDDKPHVATMDITKFPDAAKILGALCDELNERDTPKPRYKVCQNIENSFYAWDTKRELCVAHPDHIGTNRQLADDICAAFNRHVKD